MASYIRVFAVPRGTALRVSGPLWYFTRAAETRIGSPYRQDRACCNFSRSQFNPAPVVPRALAGNMRIRVYGTSEEQNNPARYCAHFPRPPCHDREQRFLMQRTDSVPSAWRHPAFDNSSQSIEITPCIHEAFVCSVMPYSCSNALLRASMAVAFSLIGLPFIAFSVIR